MVRIFPLQYLEGVFDLSAQSGDAIVATVLVLIFVVACAFVLVYEAIHLFYAVRCFVAPEKANGTKLKKAGGYANEICVLLLDFIAYGLIYSAFLAFGANYGSFVVLIALCVACIVLGVLAKRKVKKSFAES